MSLEKLQNPAFPKAMKSSWKTSMGIGNNCFPHFYYPDLPELCYLTCLMWMRAGSVMLAGWGHCHHHRKPCITGTRAAWGGPVAICSPAAVCARVCALPAVWEALETLSCLWAKVKLSSSCKQSFPCCPHWNNVSKSWDSEPHSSGIAQAHLWLSLLETSAKEGELCKVQPLPFAQPRALSPCKDASCGAALDPIVYGGAPSTARTRHALAQEADTAPALFHLHIRDK